MSKSASKRSNASARKIAAAMTVPDGATVPYAPADALQASRVLGLDSLTIGEVSWALVAELLNKRIAKRFRGKARAFEPYPSPQAQNLFVYNVPSPDPIRPRRESTEDRYIASLFGNPEEQW